MTPTAATRRRFISELRRLRADAGLTQRQVADKLYWSPSKMIRVEQGTSGISVTDLHALLRLYRVTDDSDVEELTRMSRDAKKRPRFASYADVASPEMIEYFGHEADAALLRQVALHIVPGLLQTVEYSRALFDATRVDSKRQDRLIESRQERRELFEREPPPQTFFVIDEAALRREVGGPDVLARQIDHLVAMAALPTVTIQMLPFTAGAYPPIAGPFIHLEFPGAADPDVLFFENPISDLLSRDDAELTSTYRLRFWDLEDLAAPPEEFEKLARR